MKDFINQIKVSIKSQKKLLHLGASRWLLDCKLHSISFPGTLKGLFKVDQILEIMYLTGDFGRHVAEMF